MNNRDRQQRYLIKRRLEAREYLGSICANCGSTGYLEFDHIIPSEKEFEISSAIARHMAWEKLVIELNKCQLLCKICHNDKTSLESKKKITHGKEWAAYHWKCECDECDAYKKRRNKTDRSLIKHGTRAGYLKEGRLKLERCLACKQANTEYHRLIKS